MKPEREMLGMKRWYEHIPRHLTFSAATLSAWFNERDQKPCLMRGSVYALRMRGEWPGNRKSCWAEKVLERQVTRWLRKSRITCLSSKEWEGMIYENFWIAKLERLKRYGSGKWWGMDWLRRRVETNWDWSSGTRKPDGGYVLVNGERVLVDAEQLEALQQMHHLERKLRVAA
jgi:hypothetical protein